MSATTALTPLGAAPQRLDPASQSAPEPLSSLSLSILEEVRDVLRRKYDVDFTPAQIASAVITAQGVEGCAAAFGVLFAEQPAADQTSELGLEDPPLDADQR